MARVCVVGSCNIDLTFLAARLPRAGETVAGTGFRQGFGGKGANQAVLAARLGAEVTLIGRVGDDEFGRQTLRHLQEEGIDVAHVRVTSGLPTGVAGIVVDEAARNCIVVVPGANGALTADDVQSAAEALRRAAVVVAQLEVPVEAVRAAFALARERSVPTLLNPAPALELPADLWPLVDLCVPNETELEALTNLPARTLAEVELAARELLRRGAGQAIVTLGERGALLVGAGEARHIPAVHVVAVDPTAAGDAFIGALAVFLAEWRGLDLERAAAVAALTVTRPGAQSSFPTRAEVEAFLADGDRRGPR